MNLYRISQIVNNDYDTYDSAVVCAESEEAARNMHPSGCEWEGAWERYGNWCGKDDVQVAIIGKAEDSIERGVVCASFNAG